MTSVHKLNNLLAVIVAAVFAFSCQEKKEIKINPNILKLEYKSQISNLIFNYEAQNVNNCLYSNLKIYRSNNILIETNNCVDTKIPSYKLGVYKNIVKEAEKLKRKLNINLMTNIKNEFEIFAKESLLNERLNSLVQSLFYHNAIISVTERSLKNNSECECTPHPGYFIDYKPFWCQEDYFIKVDRFAERIKNSNLDTSYKNKIIDFLKKQKKKQVSLDKISNFIESKKLFMTRVKSDFDRANSNNSKLFSIQEHNCTLGTDLGCCGNYSGCCWYWSFWCLDHDVECLRCDKWHCGPFCIPGL